MNEFGRPSCPKDCSGRHETDSLLACRTCGGALFRVVLHFWRHQEGHAWSEVVPLDGVTAQPGPGFTCPACRRDLVRTSA